MYKSLKDCKYDILTYGFSNFWLFQIFDITSVVGPEAIQAIEDILHNEKFDPIGVADKILQIHNKFKSTIETVNILVQRLPDVKDEHIPINENENVLEIMFQSNTTLYSLSDLHDWIDKWWMIMRNFGILYDSTPEQVKLLYVQKSSPMGIEFATLIDVSGVIITTVSLIYISIDRFLKIKKQILEIEKLKLENKKIIKDLEKEAEDYKKESAERIADDILMKTNPLDKKDGEVKNGLIIAISYLHEFLENGGTVDLKLKSNDSKEENQEFIELVKSVRSLSVKLRKENLLPPFNDEERIL